MPKRLWIMAAIAILIDITSQLGLTQSAQAYGGFFCQNSLIDQNAERIITQNKNGTITAYVQIQYTGSASEFSWILPLPRPSLWNRLKYAKNLWPPSLN